MAIDFTATGGAYYRVLVNGEVVSQHSAKHKALERATELEIEDPTRVVAVELTEEIRVEAPAPVLPAWGAERRSGYERRQRDDSMNNQRRRQAQRRGPVRQYPEDPQDATVGYVTVVSVAPPALGPSDTFQITVLVESAELPALGGQRATLTGRTVTWGTSDAGVATVDSAGLVTYAGAGSCTITATCEGVPATQAITCTSPAATVSTVTVAPDPSSVSVSGTTGLAAVVRDASANILTGRTVTWASSNESVATVGADSGDDTHTVVVTGVGAGSCTITATCETVDGTSALTAATVSMDGYAELPRSTVDTTYSLPAGTVKTIKASGGDYTASQFAAALTWAAAETSAVLVIDDALLITGTYTVPGRTGAGWVYIMSASAYAGTFPRAAGVRVQVADHGSMAYIRNTATNEVALKFLPSATPPRRYRFVGIRVDSTANTAELVSISASTATEANIPEEIVFDRCDLYGVPGTYNVRRTLKLDGRSCAVVDSRLRGARDVGNSDSQAIWLNEAPGPIKIHNCLLEAASENIMAGGSGSVRTPSDVTVTNCHFYKPLAWEGVYPVKNLLELKFGQRWLVENCIFENNWAGGQQGFAILFKSTSQVGTGDGPQYVVRDITFRNNKVLNSDQWLNLAVTTEDSHQPMRNLTFRNNLFGIRKGSQPRVQILASNADGVIDGLVFTNNTFDSHHNYYAWLLDPGSAFSGTPATNFIATDNVIGGGVYGPFGASGTTISYANLSALYTTPVFTRNGLLTDASGSIWTSYPSGNTKVAIANTAAQFVDRAGGDYTLHAGSAFKGIGLAGADPGIDPTTLNAAVSGVDDIA